LDLLLWHVFPVFTEKLSLHFARCSVLGWSFFAFWAELRPWPTCAMDGGATSALGFVLSAPLPRADILRDQCWELTIQKSVCLTFLDEAPRRSRRYQMSTYFQLLKKNITPTIHSQIPENWKFIRIWFEFLVYTSFPDRKINFTNNIGRVTRIFLSPFYSFRLNLWLAWYIKR